MTFISLLVMVQLLSVRLDLLRFCLWVAALVAVLAQSVVVVVLVTIFWLLFMSQQALLR
jgi:hypothetical protein